ncbi:HNH endonuclease signature motif containing protein [Phreatobacter sp.]|uniref:HNH endonuclease signature motif containing protein n=1 Tax=Phreatobacter sp. TaxID=1966341 RepID=UPI003F701678
MSSDSHNAERRRQKALTRLGDRNPRCVVCGEDFPKCLEAHHIAGRKHDEATVFACHNCHQKLSDAQLDQPRVPDRETTREERIGYFLLGLADLFELLIKKLQEFGRHLLAQGHSSKAQGDRS